MHTSLKISKKVRFKTRKCILLGYGKRTKGYRLYGPVQRILHSHDVRFNKEKPDKVDSWSALKINVSETCVMLELPFGSDVDTIDTPTVQAPIPTLRRSTRECRSSVYYGTINVQSSHSSE